MKRVATIAVFILIGVLSLGIASCEQKQGAAGPGAQTGTEAGGQQEMGTAQQGMVDINTASVQELQTIPGIDATLAQNIVSYRDANGPFASVDDLSKVQGMDQQKLDSIRSSVMVSQPGTSGATGGTSGGTGSEGLESGGGMGSGGTSGSGEGMDSGGTSGTGDTGGMGKGSTNY
ncbi:MAG TPA: helix-hairpin-helix domain-containing protein [Deltaproteobacteria bacterium]|nr:helix-hairpin-helix domain-containing protein [Deltaproteobacteria bacterium]